MDHDNDFWWRYSKNVLFKDSRAVNELRCKMRKLSEEIIADPTSSIHHITKDISSTPRHAGILIPLFEECEEIHFLLTERSADLRSHGGDICFPGGKTDPGEDDIDSAVREAEEEIGLAKEQVEVIGFLPAMMSRYGLVCSPVVGLIDYMDFYPSANQNEVQDIFSVPLSYLLDEKNLELVERGDPSFGKWISVEWNYKRPSDGKMFRIWGLTGSILLRVLYVAFDFRPKNPKFEQIRKRYKEISEMIKRGKL